jgi:hypothetical protein
MREAITCDHAHLGAQFLLETSMPRAWLRDLSRGQVRAGPQHEASLI